MSKQPVLILGAGINGAAIARELLLNDVPVCLVDSADVASGATAYSTRLVHGGLRYLEYGEVGLVRESLRERGRLLQLAPDFVEPLQLYIPVASRMNGWLPAACRFLGLPSPAAPAGGRGLWLIGTGLWMYDLFARDGTLPGRSLRRAGAGDAPRVHERFRWMYAYYDAQMLFPERFVAALLHDAGRVAAERGLEWRVFTYHGVRRRGATVEIHRMAEPDSPVAALAPSAIINATGNWVDTALGQLSVPSKRRLMGGTKGSHFVTFHAGLREALAGRGLYVEAADGRPVFIIPWHTGSLIGTTDVPFTGDPGQAVATEEEIEYLLGAANEVLPWLQLRRDDVALHYAGVRPLPHVDRSTPAAITRRHWVEAHGGTPPTFSIIGGKLTTCRSLAEQAVATVLAGWGERPRADSRRRPIPGAAGTPATAAETARKQRELAAASRLDLASIQTIWPLCAEPVERLLEPAGDAAEDAADHRLLAGTRIPRRFVRHVLRREWVTRLVDVVERRLMLLYDQRLSGECLRELAELMVEAGLLAAGDVASEIEHCRQRLWTHYGKQLADAPRPADR